MTNSKEIQKGVKSDADMLDKIIEKVQTKEDFERFLVYLMEDFKHNKNSWENRDLESYLDGLYGFMKDISGYYKNMGEIAPHEPSWKMFADILSAGRVYE